MPQKANPIDSETVVGLSVLAAQQVPALLAAMRAGHERSAGEWQVEWDAIPLIVAAGRGRSRAQRGSSAASRSSPSACAPTTSSRAD